MTEREKLGAKLDPALREWIDEVIVPGMVRLYVGRTQKRDSLCLKVVANSRTTELPSEVCQ